MNVTAQAGDTLIQAGGPLPPNVPELKRRVRSALRHSRKAIPPFERRKAAQRAAASLMRYPPLRRARRVALYLPVGSEVPTQLLISTLRARGLAVFVPAIVRGALRFRALGDGRGLHRHALGMLQPRSGRGLRASALDVVILPLLGFDARGTRLGQGGGYYDRALSRCRFRPYRLGLGFACQEVERLPREVFDAPLDAVLTERGLTRFHRGD